MTLAAAAEQVPSGADFCQIEDTTRSSRVSCDNGGYWYKWQVGGENDYDAERDASGNLLYYHAFGYVNECGLPDEYQIGEIKAGEIVGECFTDEPCAPCASSANGEGGASGSNGIAGAAGASGEVPRCPSQ